MQLDRGETFGLTLALLAALLAIAVGLASHESANSGHVYTTVSSPGDTLWFWRTACSAQQSMGLDVRLDGAIVYHTTFPICHIIRPSAAGRVQYSMDLSFSFRSPRAIVWLGYRNGTEDTTEAGRVVEGLISQAGADRTDMLLDVLFMLRDTIEMHSMLVVRPEGRSDIELGHGLQVATYPLEP